MILLLLWASIVISSPIPPTIPLPDEIFTRKESTSKLVHSSTKLVPSESTVVDNAKSTPEASVTGTRSLPDISVTSEVRTVSLQVAEGGVHMLKHMVHPMVFGKAHDTFVEPIEIEAPGVTPTLISLVTSIPSKVVYVNPVSSKDGKARSVYIPTPTIDGKPENITVLSTKSSEPEVIPIISTKEPNTGVELIPNPSMKESTKDAGGVGSIREDSILEVVREKRIFPKTNSNLTQHETSHATIRNVTELTSTLQTNVSKSEIPPSQDNLVPPEVMHTTLPNLEIPMETSTYPELKVAPRQADIESFFATEEPVYQEEPMNTEQSEEFPELLLPSDNDNPTTHESLISDDDSVIRSGETIITTKSQPTDKNVEVVSQTEETRLDTSTSDSIQFFDFDSLQTSTESFKTSAVKGRHGHHTETDIKEISPKYPPSEVISHDHPANNAHLITGSWNSRSLEPILDNLEQRQLSSVSPQLQNSPTVSEQKNSSMSPVYISLLFFSFLGLVIITGVTYRYWLLRENGIRPKHLSDRSCSNSDSGGYFDDQCRVAYVNSQLDVSKGTPDDLVSLDNDSFLNSLESMTIQNLWTDNIRHTKL